MRYMRKMHPSLDILCDSMGRVFIPSARGHKAHWTFGNLDSDGYRKVIINRKTYRVSRLICETFHGLAPAERPTCDHVDRNRDSNVPENLRWANMHTQANNTRKVLNRNDYGVRERDNKRDYCRAYSAAHYVAQKAKGLVRRKGSDGKKHWVAKEN